MFILDIFSDSNNFFFSTKGDYFEDKLGKDTIKLHFSDKTFSFLLPQFLDSGKEYKACFL